MKKLNSLNTVDINDKEKQKLKMKLILTDIIGVFLNFKSNLEASNIPLWLTQLVEELKKPSNMQLTLSEMTVLTRKTREHISRSFKKYYNMTVSDFMNQQRLNYSANLLLNTNLSVIDICYECGFQNLSWFYRNFKKKFSTSPIQFRKHTNMVIPQ